jgi:transcriptional regulator with XRE-family HTH domain
MVPRKRGRVDETFSHRLRAARIKAGLSLEDLAKKLGGLVSRQALAKYEKGLITPSPRVLSHLLQVLEIPPLIEVQDKFLALENLSKAADLKKEASDFRSYFVRRANNRDFHQNEKEIRIDFLLSEPSMAAPSIRARKLMADIQTEVRLIQAQEEGIQLRPNLRLPAKQFLALKIKLAEMMARYIWLEKLLRMEIIFLSPFSSEERRGLKTASQVERAAEKLRDHWHLGTGTVVNLLAFLEDRGIKTFKIEGPEEFESLCGFYSGHPFIALQARMPVDRIRFKTSNELAHILFGFAESPAELKLYSHFAGAFLLPARKLEEYFLPVGRKIALSELAEIKLRYGLSLQATMHRALDLGLVTERRFRSFRELMAEKGWLRHEPVEYKGEENPVRFRRLLHYAVSSGILDLETAASLAEMKPEELKEEIGEIF